MDHFSSGAGGINSITPEKNKKKIGKKAIIILLALLLAGVGIYVFKDSIFPVKVEDDRNEQKNTAEPTEDYSIEVKTDKNSYEYNEPVKFTITNKGRKDIWTTSLPERCEKDLYYFVMEKTSEKKWAALSLWPICQPDESDLKVMEIIKLDSQNKVDGLWNQKVVFGFGEAYARPGTYKISFYYNKSEITKDNIESLGAPESVESNEFEIRPSSGNGGITDSLKKAYDVKRKSDLARIRIALEDFADINGKYPISADVSKLSNDSALSKELLGYSGAADFQDPKYPEYYYGYKSDGATFELTARLEILSDKDCRLISKDLCIYKIISQ